MRTGIPLSPTKSCLYILNLKLAIKYVHGAQFKKEPFFPSLILGYSGTLKYTSKFSLTFLVPKHFYFYATYGLVPFFNIWNCWESAESQLSFLLKGCVRYFFRLFLLGFKQTLADETREFLFSKLVVYNCAK